MTIDGELIFVFSFRFSHEYSNHGGPVAGEVPSLEVHEKMSGHEYGTLTVNIN